MIDTFLFVGLPYLALAVCISGTIYRLKFRPFSQSALSSQFLESDQLLWGSLPWHIGILLILVAHFLALIVPHLWYGALLRRTCLYVVEGTGIALAVLALVGLLVLLVRRVTSARVRAVTTAMDLVVLLLLIAQVVLGLITAVSYRWGALWATATATPYVWSILTFRPDPAFVLELPVVVKAHIIGFWLLLLALPFSRLIHMFALPIEYLWRPPQKVVWSTPAHEAGAADKTEG